MSVPVVSVLGTSEGGSGTNFALGPVSPSANRLLVLVLSALVTSGTAPSDPTSITGWGLTWQKVDASVINNVFTIRQRLMVYVAKTVAAPGSGSISADFDISMFNFDGRLFEVQSANLTGTALNAIVQFAHVDDTSGADST